MPIPSAWVDRIFTKLELTYGHRFMSQWPGMSVEAIKADWQHELDGMEAHPEAIKHALEHLDPDSPPNVLQFRKACNRAPSKPAPQLEAPPADPARVAAELAKAKGGVQNWDRLEPIRRLMYREMQGDRTVNKAQRDFWRVALASEISTKYGIDTKQPFQLADLVQAIDAQQRAAA